MFPNTFPQLSGPQMQTMPGQALPPATLMQMLNSNPYAQFQQAMQAMQRSQQDLRAPNVGAQFTHYAPPQGQSGAPNPQGGGY